MLRNKLVFLLALGMSLVVMPVMSQEVTQTELNQLKNLRDLYNEQQSSVDRYMRNLERMRDQLVADRKELSNLGQRRDEARDKLEAARQADRQFPELNLGNQIREHHDKYQQAQNDFMNQEREVQDLETNVFQAENSSRAVVSERDHRKRRLENALDNIASRLVNAKVADMQRGQRQTGIGTASCGEMTVPQCRSKARQLAEQNASEKGSVLTVGAVTEIRNFQLQKEQVRSEVSATLSDVVEKSAKMNDDYTSFRVEIEATVSPVITESLHKSMMDAEKMDILSKIGGVNDFTFDSVPATIPPPKVPPQNPVADPEYKKPEPKPVYTPPPEPIRPAATVEPERKVYTPPPKRDVYVPPAPTIKKEEEEKPRRRAIGGF